MPEVFSEKQKKVLFWKPKDFNIIYGRTGSGKSFIVNLRAYTDLFDSPPGSVGIITGVSSDTIRANIVDPLLKIDPHHLAFTGGELLFPGKRKFRCIGAYNDGADKRIQGVPECHLMIMDEAAKLPQSFIEMAIIRAKARNKISGEMEVTPIWMTLNAGHPSNFIKKKFIDNPDLRPIEKDIRESKTIREFIFWGEDNATNTPEFLKKQEASATGLFLQRMIHNLWVASSGGYFDREWCQEVLAPPKERRIVRFWDLAHSKKTEDNDPDSTAGVRMSQGADGKFYVEHANECQLDPGDRDKFIREVAKHDPQGTMGGIEVEPGPYAKDHIRQLISYLAGFPYQGIPVSGRGDKAMRFAPLSSMCKAGNVLFVKGPWNDSVYTQLESFDGMGKQHDDLVDACSGAFQMLTGRKAILTME